MCFKLLNSKISDFRIESLKMVNESAPPLVKVETAIERESTEELRPDSPMIPSPDGMPETKDSWLKWAQYKVKQHKSYTWLSNFAKFVGPGYLIAVGYIDPGNWATDLSAGSQARSAFLPVHQESNASPSVWLRIVVDYSPLKHHGRSAPESLCSSGGRYGS